MRNKKQESFLENGRKLLEARIASCYGRENPIKIFSAHQVHQAIEDFKKNHPIPTNLSGGPHHSWSKGILDDRLVLIKKFMYTGAYDAEVYRDIVIASMMSSHKNVLKLLGCCLEHQPPSIIYEYSELGPLNHNGSTDHGGLLPWKSRLKIAKEVASAVAYLHTAFPRPIIHRDIKPENIFLDHPCVAKLSDFSLSISIPEGQSQVEDGCAGTVGFLDPFYWRTSIITEKTDVYSFGMLLLVLFCGRKPLDVCAEHIELVEHVKFFVEKDGFYEMVDPTIIAEAAGNEQELELQMQLQAFLALGLSCINLNPDDRPTMVEVARELLRIEKSITDQSLHPN